MKRVVLGLLGLFGAAVCGIGDAKPPESSWIDLFNGRDLSGWTALTGAGGLKAERPAHVEQTFFVRGGVLHVTGSPNGYLRTNRQYSSYELTVDWRWSVPAPVRPNNSGVLLRVGSPDRLWPMSYEAEMSEYGRANYRDRSNVGDLIILGYDKASFRSEPSLVNSLGPPDGTAGFSFKDFHRVRMVDAERPAGEWNTYDILVDHDRLVLKLNGRVVNEGSGAEDVPGYIALQSEGSPVEFRKIRLRPIS